MTLREYAQIVGRAVADAYNNKNSYALDRAFSEADQTLDRNHISPSERKEFWTEVDEVSSHSMLLEKQANSALLALMQTIQREIAVRTGKAK